MKRFIATALVALALAAPLGACGKKGDLEPPEDSRFPKTYPTR